MRNKSVFILLTVFKNTCPSKDTKSFIIGNVNKKENRRQPLYWLTFLNTWYKHSARADHAFTVNFH